MSFVHFNALDQEAQLNLRSLGWSAATIDALDAERMASWSGAERAAFAKLAHHQPYRVEDLPRAPRASAPSVSATGASYNRLYGDLSVSHARGGALTISGTGEEKSDNALSQTYNVTGVETRSRQRGQVTATSTETKETTIAITPAGRATRAAQQDIKQGASLTSTTQNIAGNGKTTTTSDTEDKSGLTRQTEPKTARIDAKAGHDFTPQFIEDWAKAKSVELSSAVQAHINGLVPPSITPKASVAITAKLAGSASVRDGAASRAGLGATVGAAISVGYGYKLSDLLKKFGAEDALKYDLVLPFFGEKLSLAAEADASVFAGIDGSISATLGLNTPASLESFASKLLGFVNESTEEAAKKSADETAASARQQPSANSTNAINTGPQPESKTQRDASKIGGGFSAAGSVFAGVKAGVTGKAAARWDRKPAKAYGDMMSLQGLGVLAVLCPQLGVALGVLKAIDAISPELTALHIYPAIFGSKAGATDLAALSATIEGMAGAAAGFAASLSFEGGKLNAKCEGTATWGLGGSVKTALALDPIEMIRLALICQMAGANFIAELGAAAMQGKLKERIEEAVSKSLDDFARANPRLLIAVFKKDGVPRGVPAKVVSEWISSLSTRFTFGAEQWAIRELLDHAEREGMLEEVARSIEVKNFVKIDPDLWTGRPNIVKTVLGGGQFAAKITGGFPPAQDVKLYQQKPYAIFPKGADEEVVASAAGASKLDDAKEYVAGGLRSLKESVQSRLSGEETQAPPADSREAKNCKRLRRGTGYWEASDGSWGAYVSGPTASKNVELSSGKNAAVGLFAAEQLIDVKKEAMSDVWIKEASA